MTLTMEQMKIPVDDEGWFTTLPFQNFQQASTIVSLYFEKWQEVELTKLGNGWVIKYRKRRCEEDENQPLGL